MMLEVGITHRQGSFTLDAHFAGGPGLTALFGRSGSGKTSIVNAIAGLVRPDAGRIVVDGTPLVDTAHGVFVPKHKRRIGYVFQEDRLFPHLTVRHNLLFGRWFTARAERTGKLADVVALLGIERLLDRRPRALSGGEKQRVAIGRALLASPRLLLMDEPLASLDAQRKDEILPYIERLRDESRIPIVYVSHSVAEVARLATTMVLMSHGRVDAVGPVTEVLGRLDLYPKTGRFEAGAVLDTTVVGHDERYALTRLRCGAGEITVPRLALSPGARVRIRIRARDVAIALAPPQGLSALNVLPARIAEVGGDGGPVVDVRLALGERFILARVTRRSIAELGLTVGRDVYAVVKSVAVDRPGFGGRVGDDDDALDT
ncbi:MAG: molybdenum ABC transporter ATP-binding protein [Alphaproteobacteria bacterium]|nr:molybdenum ABC transporter ATP-binding protein [Alphaproteobacteria bacterium]